MRTRKTPGEITAHDVRQIRLALNLSTTGLAMVLRMPPTGDRTIRRWESGKQPDIPGPVQALLAVLEESREAREILSVPAMQRRYPPGIPGPRPADDSRPRKRA